MSASTTSHHNFRKTPRLSDHEWSHPQERVIYSHRRFMGRIRRRGYLDHAFMAHCTILPHLRAQWGTVTHCWTRPQHQMHFHATLLIMVIEIRFNFQIHVQCAKKAISKITFSIQWNRSWHTCVSKGDWHERVREQWGLSGLSTIRPGLAAWPGVGWGGVGGVWALRLFE